MHHLQTGIKHGFPLRLGICQSFEAPRKGIDQLVTGNGLLAGVDIAHQIVNDKGQKANPETLGDNVEILRDQRVYSCDLADLKPSHDDQRNPHLDQAKEEGGCRTMLANQLQHQDEQQPKAGLLRVRAQVGDQEGNRDHADLRSDELRFRAIEHLSPGFGHKHARRKIGQVKNEPKRHSRRRHAGQCCQ